MKRIITISGSAAIVIAIVAVLCSYTGKLIFKDDNKAYHDAFVRNYKIFSVDVPEKLDFCGETVPIDHYFVRESFDRELLATTFWHSNTILMFKRAYRWAPVLLPVLLKNKVPEDIFYLCMAESGLDNVVSPAGAAGFWQIMKSTANEQGLEVTAEVDERNNVIKSTQAACKILNGSYTKYKSWTLAAAAYNMGPDALDKSIAAQKCDNYYDLNLNRETLRYIYRILAIKTIFKNPVHYGFYLRKKDFYPPVPTQTITVDTTIAELADFAKGQSISYRVLKELNPWLLKSSLPVKEGKKYELLVPLKGVISYKALMEKLTGDSLLFNDTLRIDEIN
jgi:membrane-bound lytic murein transglycosylase D